MNCEFFCLLFFYKLLQRVSVKCPIFLFRALLLLMGVQDLLKLIRSCQGHDPNTRYDNLLEAGFGDRRIGVDISVYMHILLTKDDVAKAFHQRPAKSLRIHVDNYFDSILESFRQLNLVPIMVFDGRNHSNNFFYFSLLRQVRVN